MNLNLVTCPHCQTRMRVAADGLCAHCRQPVAAVHPAAEVPMAPAPAVPPSASPSPFARYGGPVLGVTVAAVARNVYATRGFDTMTVAVGVAALVGGVVALVVLDRLWRR